MSQAANKGLGHWSALALQHCWQKGRRGAHLLRLSTFVRCQGGLHRPPERKKAALAAAEVVYGAMGPFKSMGFPHYYEDFVLALSRVLDPSGPSTLKKKEQIKKALSLLFDKD